MHGLFLSEVGIPFILVPYLTELYHRDGITQDMLAQRVCMDKGSTAGLWRSSNESAWSGAWRILPTGGKNLFT